MSWRHLLWPAGATRTERLFRWVVALGGLSLLVGRLLPTPGYAFPVINLLLLWIGGPSLLLFPFLASRLLQQAARRHPDTAWRGLLRLGSALLLLFGIGQALLLVLLLLLAQVPFEAEPRADGDSFFG